MRTPTRMPGSMGRVGFRYNSPRISPGEAGEPSEDEFVFTGSITDQTYKFTPNNSGMVIVGFFGRHRPILSVPFKIEATLNGRPMQVIAPETARPDSGIPGFFYIDGVVADEPAEIEVTLISGTCDTGALKVMNPVSYEAISGAQNAPWEGERGAGAGMHYSIQNDGVEQVLHIGGYGGIRTPIRVENVPGDESSASEWIKSRSNLRVESTVQAGSTTSVVFSQIETRAVPCAFMQWPNDFSPENGYGLAVFRAKDLGLTAP